MNVTHLFAMQIVFWETTRLKNPEILGFGKKKKDSPGQDPIQFTKPLKECAVLLLDLTEV